MLATYSLFQSGLSVQQIVKQRGLTANTIEEHLHKCLIAGLEVDVSRLVSMHDRVLIEAAIQQKGSMKLRELKDVLPGTITYAMIRFIVAESQRVVT